MRKVTYLLVTLMLCLLVLPISSAKAETIVTEDELDGPLSQGKERVIVAFKDGYAIDTSLVTKYNGDLIRIFVWEAIKIRWIICRIPPENIEPLQNEPAVEWVAIDVILRADDPIGRERADGEEPPGPKTIEVHPGGSIQGAINQASSGDTVFVFAGVYSGEVLMRSGVNLIGESRDKVTLKGRVSFKDANSTLKDFTILFPEGSVLSYTNLYIPHYYENWKFQANAGITAINSVPLIQNCIIEPDLVTINALHPGNPPLVYYGTAIQVLNMYKNPDIEPIVEKNLIRNTNRGIFYFSQASGGAIYGEINNNTFYHNKIGITLRMHKENPHIYNNIFDDCLDSAIFLAYEDGELFTHRKTNMNNNLFYDNTENFWLDSAQAPFDLIDIQGNLDNDPLFIDPNSGNFYLSEQSPARGTGQGGENIGSYSADLQYPMIEDILPIESRFIGLSKINISGTAYDDNGIFSVYVNSDPAVINGSAFSLEGISLDYGLNNISITAKDVAQKDTTVSKAIYNFRMPVAPPQ